MTIHSNGLTPRESIVRLEAGPTIMEALAQLPEETSVEEVRKWALNELDSVSELEPADFALFCEGLRGRGVTSMWIIRDLNKAINAVRRSNSQGVTWTDYVKAAQAMGHTFRLNELDDSLECDGEKMSDVTEASILSHLHAQGLRNTDVARRAFLTEAGMHSYHPVKQYLEGLEWDGKDHIAHLCTFFTDSHEPIHYADGTVRTALHAFHRRWFIGAVGKVYNPHRFQNPMLILDGEQGKGKSFYAKWLCSPLPHLHFEGAIRPDDKDYLGFLTRCWVWEVGELGATMRRADREALKGFVTQQEATYRPAFGRYALHKSALASFIGTVNLEGDLLNDPTGHRRFRPVNVTSLDWSYRSKVNIHQVWAQAYALYKQGETHHLSSEEALAHKYITGLYEAEDIYEGYMWKYFDVDPNNNELFTLTSDIIHALRTYTNVQGPDKSLAMHLAITLKRMGLQKTKPGKLWGWQGLSLKTEYAN